MNDIKLGKLEHVPVREAWEHEAHHFTPWLADNLDLLGEKLGINIEMEKTEMQVGGYRADIVARDLHDNSIVLIENQLETADLQHLGQVLAYMAGLDAHTIVWIASGFKDIHRTAIRWLNEHTADPFAFFAVQVSTVRIGNSPPAPVFEILEQPNTWQREAHEANPGRGASEHGTARRAFWAHFAKRIPGAPGLRPGYSGSNVWHWIEEANLTISQYLSHKEVGVYIMGKWGESIDDAAPRIEPYIGALRNAVESNDHFNYGDRHRCVIHLPADYYQDHEDWDRLADWLDDRRRRYEKILRATPP